MRFVLYTDKTVAQCMNALNARMQARTRPDLDGWVEKSGGFSLAVTSPVARRFRRTTYLRGKVEREGGVSVIRGSVPSGATRENQAIIFGALALIAVALAGGGNVLLALVVLPVGAALYIPLMGDHQNSAILLHELKKTLKARPTPPKTAASRKSETRAAPRRAASRPAPAASKPAPAARPAMLDLADDEDDDEEEELDEAEHELDDDREKGATP